MIRIVVDSEDEAKIVRRVLKTEACSHKLCGKNLDDSCEKCVKEYYENTTVRLYKRESVEIPISVVV